MCDCGHEHASDAASEGESLYGCLDLVNIACLNGVGVAPGPFKPLSARLCRSVFLESPPDDCDLLFKVPFTSDVRVRSICISAGPGRSPTKARLFANNARVDFSSLDSISPTHVLSALPEDPASELWHPLPTARFGSVNHLCIALSGCSGGEGGAAAGGAGGGGGGGGGGGVRIFYIGIKGVDTKAKKVVVEAVYELRGLPKGMKGGEGAAASAGSGGGGVM